MSSVINFAKTYKLIFVTFIFIYIPVTRMLQLIKLKIRCDLNLPETVF